MSKWPGIPSLNDTPTYDFKQSIDELEAEMIAKTIKRQFDAINAPSCLREWYSETLDLLTDDGLYKDGYCWGFLHGDSTPNKHWINERMWILGFVDGKGDRE